MGIYLNGGRQRSTVENMVASFERQNPDIDIQPRFGTGKAYVDGVKRWFAEKQGPDIIYWLGGKRLIEFDDYGGVKDLSSLWERYALYEHFVPGAERASSTAGRPHAIPITYSLLGMYYNPEVFEKYGVDVPENWDDLLVACRAFRKHDVDLLSIGLRHRWVTHGWFDYLNLRINGLEFYQQLLAGRVAYTDPRVGKALAYWKQLIASGCFNHNADKYGRWQAFPRMVYGFSAMMLIEGTPEQMPVEKSKHLRIMNFPPIEKGLPQYSNASVDVFVVPKYAKLTAEVERVLLFLASSEFQVGYNESIGRLPAYQNGQSYSEGPAKDMYRLAYHQPFGIQYFDRDTSIKLASRTPDIFYDFFYELDVAKTQAQLEALRQEVYGDLPVKEAGEALGSAEKARQSPAADVLKGSSSSSEQIKTGLGLAEADAPSKPSP
ncbi:ABC transporter substrate-binding protein [Agaribacterium haliotis]|uniref:ABC transporter substrate-binding protein n=1 Tax=Agaribacterium haliotis TaxID=2013869 RepID=UPI0011785CF3|nr:ABC transporter substrate-binding protein [Agaribacterium haliotis]